MKFSFKKGGGGDKPAKPAKRASRSGSDGGLASAKVFLVDHLEKILLTVITALALMIIYSGFKKERLESSPQDLEGAILLAKKTINEPTWPNVRQQRYPDSDTFDQQATADTEAIKDEDFQLSLPFHPILKEGQKRRADPQLVPPIEIEIRAGYGPLALKRTDPSGGGRFSNFLGSEDTSDKSRPLPDKYRQLGRDFISTGDSPTESTFFVSITGLVPIKQQAEAYREAFEGAAEFLAERDRPNYLAMNVERAEVGEDGQPGAWSNLNALGVMRREPLRWEVSLEERVAADYIIERLLMPLPPLRFRDVSQWTTHSKIPLEALGRDGLKLDERGPAEPETTRPADEPIDLFGGVTRSSRGGEPRAEMSTDEEPSVEARDVENDSAAAYRTKVEFGLLRFFDFTVEPGKKYVYRVQLVLEDPNNPHNFSRPGASSCETNVVVRRQANPTKHSVETPWSEASRVATLPSGRGVLAGPVVQPKLYPVSDSNRRIRLPRRPGEEPQATVMAVVWDREKAMDVPAEIPIRRGSVINGTVTTEAIDTSRSNVIELENYELRTNALVLDIAGGEPLDGSAKLRAPGLILLMTSDGQLVFHNEVLDYGQLDYHTIPQDEDLLLQREQDSAAREEEENRGGRARPGENRGPEDRGEPRFNEGGRRGRGGRGR